MQGWVGRAAGSAQSIQREASGLRALRVGAAGAANL